MLTTIQYEVIRENEETGEEEHIATVNVEGEYDPGEREGRWGYYGATPASPASVDIISITETIAVEGPVHSKYARYPVTYEIPWDGELNDWEIEYIKESIAEISIRDAADNKASAAIDAYESRDYDGY
jgi:hypothetical protein